MVGEKGRYGTMSDDDDQDKPLTSGDRSEGPTLFSNLGQIVSKRAKRRHLEEENKLGRVLVEYNNIQVDLSDSQAAVIAAQERNSNMDAIKEKAADQLQAELGAIKQTLQEQDIQSQQLDAEAAEIVGRHEANKATEAARKTQAEAAEKQAEADKGKAEIQLELAKAQLDRLRNNREGVLADIDKDLEDAEKEKLDVEREIEDLMDPVLDDDESQPLRLKQATNRLAKLEQKTADLKRRREELS